MCGLSDLGFIGHSFTWTNGREEIENIQCRLDQALASEGMINKFFPIKVKHPPRFGSDHSTLQRLLQR